MDDVPKKAPAKASPIPSWVSVGFLAGALFVLALPRRRASPAPRAEAPAQRAEPPRAAPRLTTIEAVFAEWGNRAVWKDDLTEVALWDSATRDFTDCYEVLRAGGTYFFRSIPHLTRPVVTHGVEEGSPLEFTETPEKRAEWLNDVRKENWRSFSEGARQAFGTPPAPKAEPVPPPPVQLKPDNASPPR